MPISQAGFVRTTVIVLAAGILVLVGIVGAVTWLTNQSATQFAEVVRARDVRSASADLLALVQDAETGQRGFLLTRDSSYLDPYNRAQGALEQGLARFRESASGDAAIAALVPGLSGTLHQKFGELKQTIELGQGGDWARALAEIDTDRGKRLMDEARATFGQVLQISESNLRNSIAAQETTLARLRWVAIGGALALLSMAALAVWTIWEYTRELAIARSELQHLNVGLEERVKERTEDLMRANEEIQRFAYIVTHDLRAPLVNIMGFTSELEAAMKPIQAHAQAEEGTDESLRAEAKQAALEDLPEALGFIRSSTKKMDGLINAILKISRDGRRTLKPEPIDLNQLLETAAAAVHHQASQDGGGISIEAKVPMMVSDRMSLEQALGNLIDNAIKYRSTERPIEITILARKESLGRVAIEVRDNGRGIADTDHERIFELFRRSGTQDQPGEGIGLAHVRTLIRNLGGDISVRSVFGQGSTFRIVLPADVRTVKRSAAA